MSPSITQVPHTPGPAHADVEAPAVRHGAGTGSTPDAAAAHISSDRADIHPVATPNSAPAAPSRWRRFAKIAGLAALVLGGGAGTSESIRAIVASRRPKPGAFTYTRTPYVYDGNIGVAKPLNHTYSEAVAYFSQAPRAKKMYEKLRKAEPYLGLSYLSIDELSASEFAGMSNSIYLNDTHKILFPTGDKIEDVGVASIAGSLQHEMTHAEHAHDNFASYMVRSALPHPDFDNLEERETILQVNKDNAYLPGEAIRDDHHNAVYARALNVTDTSKIGFAANATVVAHKYDNGLRTNTTTRYELNQFSAAEAKEDFLEDAFLFPETFNRSTVEKTLGLIDRGWNITSNYATAKNAGGDVTELKKDLDAYVEEGRAFAAAVKYVKPHSNSTSRRAFGPGLAPAPAPSGSRVTLPPLAPILEHGAPAGEAAPVAP